MYHATPNTVYFYIIESIIIIIIIIIIKSVGVAN